VDIRERKKKKQNYIPLIIVFQIQIFGVMKTVIQQGSFVGENAQNWHHLIIVLFLWSIDKKETR